ncbi:MAG TPA: hypothetical protein DCR93_21565 [Cytophagales bacterium]|nr:hypothetical protein [Cytophagales bacterium]HAP61974.1 hypothetical protein [Cytophagales bacterium]
MGLALIEFQMPGVEWVQSDLREIPLLISVLYLPHPLYLLFISLITVLYTPEGFPVITNFLMHWVALSGMWYFVRWGHQKSHRIRSQTAWWAVGILLYYWVIMLPIIPIVDSLMGSPSGHAPLQLYSSIWMGAWSEVIFSLITTTLFANQYYYQHQLREHMEVIAFRNLQLANYAFINSHKLRAPVARLLGLAHLMKKEEMVFTDPHLLGHFEESCQELDTIVKKISEMLEEETSDSGLMDSEMDPS